VAPFRLAAEVALEEYQATLAGFAGAAVRQFNETGTKQEEGHMIWISILIGVISGAAAALVAGLLVKDRKEHKSRYQIALVVCFALFFVIAKATIAPPLQRHYMAYAIEGALRDSPAFVALKKHEPETYRGIMDQASQALRDGKPMLEVTHQMRAYIPKVVEKRLPRASDEAAFSYMRANIEELKELMAVQDDACYRFLFPGSGAPIDVQARLKKETMRADLEGLANVLESAATAPRPVPKLQDVQPFLGPIYTEVSGKYGKDMEAISTPQSGLTARRKVCDIMAELYGKILMLPPSQGGKVLRFMLAPENQ
jgi:hypothetical protein